MNPLETPPVIPPVTGDGPRPLFSVMIPTYNRFTFLGETLGSILKQDPGAAKMEIAVVDDASTQGDPSSLIEGTGRGRARLYKNDRNLGISGNFNRCIELARGQWIHILHSDDIILPGFYEQAEKLIAASEGVQAIAFRCFITDQNGTIDAVTDNLADLTANPQELRRRFLTGTPLQCAGVIVKREAYERRGGFLTSLRLFLDVEMWSRLFFQEKAVYSRECLATFRMHGASASSKIFGEALHLREQYDALPYMCKNMGLSGGEEEIYRAACHTRFHLRCKELAKLRARDVLWNCERDYFRSVQTPGEFLRFLVRLFLVGCIYMGASDANLPAA